MRCDQKKRILAQTHNNNDIFSTQYNKRTIQRQTHTLKIKSNKQKTKKAIQFQFKHITKQTKK